MIRKQTLAALGEGLSSVVGPPPSHSHQVSPRHSPSLLAEHKSHPLFMQLRRESDIPPFTHINPSPRAVKHSPRNPGRPKPESRWNLSLQVLSAFRGWSRQKCHRDKAGRKGAFPPYLDGFLHVALLRHAPRTPYGRESRRLRSYPVPPQPREQGARRSGPWASGRRAAATPGDRRS